MRHAARGCCVPVPWPVQFLPDDQAKGHVLANDSDMSYRMGELFSGPGGMALGAKLAADAIGGVKIEHAWANDYDLETCETYLRNVLKKPYSDKAVLVRETSALPQEGVVICKDVRDLDISALPKVSGFAFGFPCNDYSLVGEWKGLKGEYGPLYTYGVRVLAAQSPEWFVAENVSGLRGANEGRAFQEILAALHRPGGDLEYKLVPHLYSFDEYGVPQRRKRIVIVGIRADLEAEFRVPSPSMYANIDVTAEHALTNPPIPMQAHNHELTKQSDKVVQRLSYLQAGENAFSPRALAIMPKDLHINTRTTISTTYRRLEPDKPAYTVTGSGGGGSHMYHWVLNRALTNRERARLQTFPDWFTFEGGRSSVRRQIGMAVPPQGAAAIFTALFRSLKGTEYPSIQANINIDDVIGTRARNGRGSI